MNFILFLLGVKLGVLKRSPPFNHLVYPPSRFISSKKLMLYYLWHFCDHILRIMSILTIIRIIRGQEKFKGCKIVQWNQEVVGNLRNELLIRRSGVRIPPGVPDKSSTYNLLWVLFSWLFLLCYHFATITSCNQVEEIMPLVAILGVLSELGESTLPYVSVTQTALMASLNYVK